MDDDGLREFENRRRRLFGLAYRMLGSATEAEDAVQETYLRWDGADRAAIANPEAWLTTAVVNLCRTWLVSARARRETYPGPWLPEPVPTAELGPLETVELRESVSLALLAALERLNPLERAVFVLREAFGYPHREIAAMLEITEAASQQALHRAAERVRRGRQRFRPSGAATRELLDRFLRAASTGDVEELRTVLSRDAVATADGGGVVHAARRPVVGAERVAAYLRGLTRRGVAGMAIGLEEVNAGLALVVRVGDAPLLVMGLDVREDGIEALWLSANPEKLAYYGRVTARS
ncbi:MAG TPA: RNA polymerase sigma-70 factor [Nocardia sp.]|uniref:RNA polymerase sigma-70 factor n=1 Tax=Nocardia sp. TaxID=1821 RepID=UPI002B4AC8D1|nr:RNA polymerase sigma-70 factor [Nocardia sp.]HLS77884.1 RNA polymerase sigma-70 factor [Nocardia sp.]